MEGVNCPYCRHEFDSDDIYSAGLYEEDTHEVKCVRCLKPFMVESYSVIEFKRCTMEAFEEYDGDIGLADLLEDI